MKAPSTKKSAWDNDAGVIDIDVVTEEVETVSAERMPQNAIAQPTSPSGALVTKKGSFSEFLAPLKQETFKQVVTDVEQRLNVVNQTLSMLLDSQGFETVLQEMLSAITLKTGELLGADRTTIFLLDQEKNQLWSILAEGENGKPLELRIPADRGIAGEVATSKKVVNIPYDFYKDPRSAFSQKTEQKTGYRTYTMLTLPLLNEAQELVAVVQLLNKLKFDHDLEAPLAKRIEQKGFTEEDEKVFEEFAPSIRLILESSQAFYLATQRQRATDALIKATQSLSHSNLDLEDTLNRVMEEAKKLMNADRSTLWLLDKERNELWTKIPKVGELRVEVGQGFAGQVAASGNILNIGFDAHENPDGVTAKQTDKKTGYRTCSVLCMPVRNADGELIGVTQLLNKVKPGDFPPYNPADWPNAPECWNASFNRNDQEFMEIFNIQAGVALQNAKLFATVKQQEQMQRDILRSLSNGVISTDNKGTIIAANESAKRLIGLDVLARLEGKNIADCIRIKDGDIDKWFQMAIAATDAKGRQQYYPEQTLISTVSEEQHSVHLSINTIADANDESQTRGALVVMEDISDAKRLKSTLYRYMTQELAEQLLASGDAKLGGDRKEVSVLFSDIRGYTTLTETMEAEEVVLLLNEYFESMVDAVFKYKGTLDKYIGDAIMAVFGSPLPLEDHAWMSVQTAVEMRHRLTDFNIHRVEQRQPEVKIGIGINSDSVISGNIGSSRRMEFTAIGDGVNLGSRLESASKQYGCDIIISDSTYQPCKDRVWARELDYIRVKGKTQPVRIYELVGLRSEQVSDHKLQASELYQKARELYLKRDIPSAMGEFAKVKAMDPTDKAAGLHLERCMYWLSNPLPADWDGVWTMTEK